MKKRLFKLVLVLLSSQIFGQSEINYFNIPWRRDFPTVNYVFEGKDHLIVKSNSGDLIDGSNFVVIFNHDSSLETRNIQNLGEGNVEIIGAEPRAIDSNLYLVGSYCTSTVFNGYKRIKYNPSTFTIVQSDTIIKNVEYEFFHECVFIGLGNTLIQSFRIPNNSKGNIIMKYDILNHQIIDTFVFNRNYIYALKPLPNNEFLAIAEDDGYLPGLRAYRFNAFNQIIDSIRLQGNYPYPNNNFLHGSPSFIEFKGENYVSFLEIYYVPFTANREQYLMLQKVTPFYDSIISTKIIEEHPFNIRKGAVNAGMINYNDDYLFLIHTTQNHEDVSIGNNSFDAQEADANKIRVTKTDGENIIWKKDFGFAGKYHYVTKSFKGIAGNLIIAGASQEEGHFGFNDPFILKIDTSGNPIFLTGVKELEANKNGFNIYPNPTESTLKTSLAYKSYRIFDQSGRLILQANKNENQIDVSNLKPSLYFLNIENLNGQLLTEKFVKM